MQLSCRLSLESIQTENNALIKKIKNYERKVLSSCEEVKEQYLSTIQVLQNTRSLCWRRLLHLFLCSTVWCPVLCFQNSLKESERLQELLSVVEEKKSNLSIYLGEDSSSFSTEELFNTIKTFRGLFIRALKVSWGAANTNEKITVSKHGGQQIIGTVVLDVFCQQAATFSYLIYSFNKTTINCHIMM